MTITWIIPLNKPGTSLLDISLPTFLSTSRFWSFDLLWSLYQTNIYIQAKASRSRVSRVSSHHALGWCLGFCIRLWFMPMIWLGFRLILIRPVWNYQRCLGHSTQANSPFWWAWCCWSYWYLYLWIEGGVIRLCWGFRWTRCCFHRHLR